MISAFQEIYSSIHFLLWYLFLYLAADQCSEDKKKKSYKIEKINYDRFGFIADSFNVVKGSGKKE